MPKKNIHKHYKYVKYVEICQSIIKYNVVVKIVIMPPFEDEGVYCFAHIGWLVRRSVGP